MRPTFLALVVALCLLQSAAAAPDKVLDALALGFFADKCGFRLNPQARAYREGLKQATTAADVRKAKSFADRQFKEWVAKGDNKEGCRRFRGMLADMGWM